MADRPCPAPNGAAVIVGQRLVRPRFLLVLDYVLGTEELAVMAQVLVQILCPAP